MSPDPQVAYLDLNHWYALGAAMAGRPKQAEHVAIARTLIDEVDQGRLMFPLSAVHYMELTENPRDQYRREAADAMRAFSRYVTLTPLGKIVDEELAKELNRRFGRPAFPIKVPKFGIGVRFAFGDPKQLKLTGFTEEQRPMIEAGLGCSIEQYEAQANAALEYSVLTTPSVMRAQVSGFDPYSARRVADQQLASFNVLINTLRTDQDVSTRPLDAICARLLAGDILDNYTRALLSAGYTKGSPLRGKEDLTDFLMHLASQRVAAMIQYHYLRDVKRDWTINDLRDIDALSMAIPYCDIVVTDKKACDAAVNRAQLDREFNTKIFCRLADLAAHLEARAAV